MSRVSVLMLGLCLIWGHSVQGEIERKPTVVVRKLTAQKFFDRILYPGRVDSKVNATVLTETEGVVTQIIAPLGTRVVKGQALIEIQHTDPVFQYAPVRVVTPVSGIVSALQISVGARVEKDQKILTIVDPSRLKVLVEVAASEIQRIKVGGPATFVSDLSDAKGSQVQLKVAGVSSLVDPGTGTATCELLIDKPIDKLQTDPNSPTIYPGMVGQVVFRLRERDSIVILDSAISRDGERSFVRLVENGKIAQRNVKTGNRDREWIEVVDGLKSGDTLVERSSVRGAADGTEVDVIKTLEGTTGT